MTPFRTKFLKATLIIALLVASVLSVTGCQDFGQFPPPELPAEEPKETVPSTFITTEDRAILAVYEHLLSQALSHEAKGYLAQFYAVSDNWSARSELYKDGTTIWYVLVDKAGVETWQERPYWQQASWFVYRNGRVIPSNRLNANALRIEADLQELSSQPESEGTP